MKTTLKTLTLGLVAGSIAAPAFAQEISFWSWRQEDRAVYQQIIDAFQEANPGITVRFEAFEAATYATILSTALAAQTGPDSMMVRAYGAFETVANGGDLIPLSPEVVPGLAGFPETALAANTLRSSGQLYAVPFASQTMLVIYNRDIFEQLGLEHPQDWAELISHAEAIRAAGMFPFANGTATAWQNETIVSALTASTIGRDFFDDLIADQTDFTDPRFVHGLERLQEISAFFPDGFIGLDYASSQQLFASGMAAMFAGGSFELANFLSQNPNLNLGVFAAPGQSADDEKLVATFFDGGYAGYAPTQHPEAVKAWLAFLATPEFGQIFANELGNITPIPGVTFENPLLQDVARLNENSVPYIMLTNFRFEEPSGSVLLQAEVQRMLAGQTTPEAAARAVTEGIATYHAPFRR